MSTGIWRILGIELTTDIKEIKKAYAARSKEYHPEEHPEEFKQLQSAYKAALQYAKNGNKQADVPQEDASSPPVSQTEKNIATPEYHELPYVKMEVYDYEGIDSDTAEEKFWIQLQYILWHPFARKEYDYWYYLLNLPEVRKLMQSIDLQERFIDRLKKENFIWDWRVLYFFDSYLAGIRGIEEERAHELASSRLKPGFIRDVLGRTKKRNDTDAEQNMYQLLWWNRDDAERNNPEKYLKLYFAYAEEHKDELREIHREAHAVRRGRPAIRIIVFIIIVLVCRFFIYIDELTEQKDEPGYNVEQIYEQSVIV